MSLELPHSSAFANPFENDNAKYLDPLDIARTFVPTEDFWRLFSDKNHVIFGTRGSGKTALGRMMAHDHLRLLDHPFAKQYIKERRYIGVYAPARLNWVSGLRSQMLLQEGPDREYFILRFNFVLARAFLAAVKSCLEEYVSLRERALLEYELTQSIGSVWGGARGLPRQMYTLKDLGREISACDFRLQRITTRSFYGKSSVKISEFDSEILSTFSTHVSEPVTTLAGMVSDALKIPAAAKYVIAVDEMEFLTPENHVVLNGLLRADTPGFVFKFITAPYCHYSHATDTNAHLIEGHDFENVYIDHGRSIDAHSRETLEAKHGRGVSFPIALFLKRAAASGLRAETSTLTDLLGGSEVLDPVPVDEATILGMKEKLAEHANLKTIDRYNSLATRWLKASDKDLRREYSRKMSDEIIRKIRPVVALRESIAAIRGAKKGTAYSGFPMVIACTDLNPRVFIRALNMLFPDFKRALRDRTIVPPSRQDEVLSTLSERFLDTALAIPAVGPRLHQLIKSLGAYFSGRLHVGRIGTDTFGSIEVSDDDADLLGLIHQAVAWGYMYPHSKDERRDSLPAGAGEFRLAYVLAPHFRILPRRGRPVRPAAVFPQLTLGV